MTTTQPKRQPIPFGKYLLLDRINIGGMAEVWRGKMFGAGGFERLVAIKRILPNIAEDDEFISMFIDEAKISVQLNHANVAKIEELGQIQNNYFIAMEYIPGKDMRAIFDRCRKKSEPAPVPLVAYVVAKMCEGLDYAHRKKDGMGRDLNIVHRDISPQNILISFEGEVKVIDFGIAKAAGKATKTQAGILKGKFGYMSPEQIRGLPLDRRSDIFAIGVCLYEMLTGERLFVGDSDFSVLEKVRKAEVAPPSQYNRRIPEALEKIVLKALARDVDERYQYANELGDDLQRFLITSDSIFSRKDLMQYMKSTFAEDVEREKQRLQEYSEIKAPEGMLAAIEMGFGGVPSSPMSGSTPAVPQLPPVEAAPVNAGGARRSPTLAAMPKLTAAAPAATVQEEESGATQVVNSPEFEEPSTQPGMVGPGRTVTPVEVPRPPVLSEQPGQRAQPPRLAPVPGPPVGRPPVLAPVPPSSESTTVARQGRNTLDGMPRLVRPEPPVLESAAPPARVSASHVPVPRPPVPAPPPLELEEPTGEHGIQAESVPAPATPARQPLPPRMSPSVTEPPPPASANRLPLILGGAALLLMVLVVALVLAVRKPPMGFIMVNLPSGVKGLRVSLNAKDVEVPPSGPLIQEVKAGQVIVLVSAEGYKPFTRSVPVAEGATPAQVDATELKPEHEVRPVRVIVVTQPPDAELKVDGKVVRQKGSSSTYLADATAGTEMVVEASAPGFKPAQKRLTPSATDTQLDVQLKLEPETYDVDVSSSPPGATILLDGKELGVTPNRLRLPAAPQQLSLRLRCYDDAAVTLTPTGSGFAPVNEKLNKRHGCK